MTKEQEEFIEAHSMITSLILDGINQGGIAPPDDVVTERHDPLVDGSDVVVVLTWNRSTIPDQMAEDDEWTGSEEFSDERPVGPMLESMLDMIQWMTGDIPMSYYVDDSLVVTLHPYKGN